jgi:hypothetical protein
MIGTRLSSRSDDSSELSLLSLRTLAGFLRFPSFLFLPDFFLAGSAASSPPSSDEDERRRFGFEPLTSTFWPELLPRRLLIDLSSSEDSEAGRSSGLPSFPFRGWGAIPFGFRFEIFAAIFLLTSSSSSSSS